MEPEWITRKFNQEADEFSRLVAKDDYMVNPYILVALDDLWRPHTLDHFSNYRTHQITRFCSLWLNPCTHRSGCLHTLLVGGEQLDFVSPYLIPRGLEHMEQGMEMGTLIITLWTSAQMLQNRLGPNSTLRGYVPSSHTKCLSLKWNTMLPGPCSLVT